MATDGLPFDPALGMLPEDAAEAVMSSTLAILGEIEEVALEILKESDGSKARTLAFLASALDESAMDTKSMARFLAVIVLDRMLERLR